MPVPLGAKGQSDFDDPIGLLKDCHRRILHFINVLVEVARDASGTALTPEYRSALESGLQYFRAAGLRHTQDEEHSLFPRIRHSGAPEAHAVLDELEELEQDHVSAQVAHARADEIIHQWLRDGRLPPPLARDLLAILERMQELYQRHIELEDGRIFPLATKLLPLGELEAVGREMAQRRGLSPRLHTHAPANPVARP